MSFQQAIEDLKAQLRGFNRRLKDAESHCRAVESKVAHFECADYTTKVVDTYRSSPAFEDELYVRSNTFYDRGNAHILLQFYHLIPDKVLMCRAYESSYANPDFRNGCNFILFTDSELAEITTTDQKERR